MVISNKKRLFLDMDGTLARFHDQANYLERMFEKEFFLNLEPFQEMIDGIRLFMQAHPQVEVNIISALVNADLTFIKAEKNLWLDRYLPEIRPEHRIFTIMGENKVDSIPGGLTKNDFILDDYNRNLNEFLFFGGSAIKCHNNINMRGLGAYGGEIGRMWTGPTVHADDHPSMIAADLSRFMGLPYMLDQVLCHFDDVSFLDVRGFEGDIPYDKAFTKHLKQIDDDRFFGVLSTKSDRTLSEFRDPLNALRFLQGKKDFKEFKMRSYSDETVYATILELEAVCSNFYHSTNISRFYHSDRAQLADDVLSARQTAVTPVIGQVNYLGKNGGVTYSELFFSAEEMRKEIRTCKLHKESFEADWFIHLKKELLHEIQDPVVLADVLVVDYGLEEQTAKSTADALFTPYPQRTEEQMLDLVGTWHVLDIPGDLREFLRMSEAEMQDYLSPKDKTAEHKETDSSRPGLDVLIKSADGKKGTSEKTSVSPELDF